MSDEHRIHFLSSCSLQKAGRRQKKLTLFHAQMMNSSENASSATERCLPTPLFYADTDGIMLTRAKPIFVIFMLRVNFLFCILNLSY